MQTINALSLTQNVKDWLMDTRQPRVLHVFDDVCNLINEHRDVLSIVSPQIWNGPFNMVVEDGVNFVERISLQTPVSISGNQLQLGNLICNTGNAEIWNPRPDWDLLYPKRNDLIARLYNLSNSNYQFPISESLVSSLSSSLVSADIPSLLALTPKFAGLGVGLTPSGDDFLMGALHAAWIIHPPDIASNLGDVIARIAEPLTTSLSAAWIRSAGRGEAGELWHDLFDVSLSADKMAVEVSMQKIAGVGQTSGADALTGFLSVLNSYPEKK